MKGTRILALNLQSCYFFNFYLFSSLGDELKQLEWLEKNLREMEWNGEKAIIIAHIPPGAHDCMDSFARWYQVLADWFQHVIWTSMFGHVHAEYFNVARGVRTGKAINHDIISGSATTFTNKNPSYRVITLDQETMLPVSIKTYYLNISYFNEHPLEEAIFTELYDFAEEYGIEDLWPSNIAKVSESFLTQESQAAKYI